MSVIHNNIRYKTLNVTAGLNVSTLTESSSGPQCIIHSLYGSVS